MMPRTALSPKAAIAAGALYTYLRPRLAQDTKIDLRGLLLPMKGGKSFHDSKAAIANAVRSVTKGRLAQDADIDDVAALLDAIEGVVESPDASVPMGMGEENGELEIKDVDNDGDPEIVKDDETPELMAKVREFLKDHVSEEILAQFDQLVGSGAEGPAPEPEDMPPHEEVEEEDIVKDSRIGKPAMDAAIAAAVRNERDGQRAIRAAETAVRPFVGELAIAYDSADEVYKAALSALGVRDVEKIHPSAYPTILGMQTRPGARRETVRHAQDALPAGVKSFAERFPGAAKITHM